MATKLPIGAKIYSVKEHIVILLVESENTSKSYLSNRLSEKIDSPKNFISATDDHGSSEF